MNGEPSAEPRPGAHRLSMTLHLPEGIRVRSSRAPGRLQIYLEIRNESAGPWQGSTHTGPLLEISVHDTSGAELAREHRLCPTLALGTRLEPGVGFRLPLSVLLPPVPREGATFRIVVRLVPGDESASGEIRIDARTS